MENETINKIEPARQKFFTKDKVIAFTIGALAGAVLATAAFFIYVKVANVGSCNCEQSMQMPGGGTPPEMSSGENGTPPELPDGESGTPPEMPSGENSQNGQDSQSRQSQPPAKPGNNTNANS